MRSIHKRSVKDELLVSTEIIKPGVWVHFEEPTREELEAFGEEQHLEKGLLTDAIDPYEVPRLEFEDTIPYFFCRVPSKERRDMSTIPFMIAIHPSFVLSVAPDTHTFISAVLKNESIPPTTQKVTFLINILSHINREYFKSVMIIRKEVNRIKVSPTHVKDEDILKFVELENDLNEYLSALIAMHKMYEELYKGKVIHLFEEDADLVDDLVLGAEQLIDGIKSLMKTIVNIREAYSVVATNKLNRVITTLTVVTVILTVPTIITSFFGMNVPLPLADSKMATLFIISGSAIVMVAIFWLLKRMKLL